MQTPAAGTTVGGKYRILRVLGQGGMGAVFEAEHTLTLKRAAIKWLHPRHIGRETSRARMLQEARATSRIRHRNVVDLYDVVEEDDAIFLVMELLTGELLTQRLARERLEVHALIALLLQAMEGVAASHEVGVVHRDIKPDNIFLAESPSGVVPKIIDFGISRVADERDARLTRSGIAIGTPRYASFEQVRGERDVDGRSDVYAFGVILYEALVGRGPYTATTFGEQAVQFITSPPLPPHALRPDVPAELDAVVQRAMARDRRERFATMRALIDALAPFASAARYTGELPVLRSGDDIVLPGAIGRGDETQPGASVSAPATRAAPSVRLPSRRAQRARRALGVALLGAGFLLVPWFSTERGDGGDGDATAKAAVGGALPTSEPAADPSAEAVAPPNPGAPALPIAPPLDDSGEPSARAPEVDSEDPAREQPAPVRRRAVRPSAARRSLATRAADASSHASPASTDAGVSSTAEASMEIEPGASNVGESPNQDDPSAERSSDRVPARAGAVRREEF